MTETAPIAPDDLGSPPKLADHARLRNAAGWWLVAQIIFLLATTFYAVVFSSPEAHWATWLLWAGGPRFTTISTGIASLVFVFACAVMWAAAAWKLGSVVPANHSTTARIVHWGGPAILIVFEPLNQLSRFGVLWGTIYLPPLAQTAERALCLAIALHLRALNREFGAPRLAALLDFLLLVVALNLVDAAAFWMRLKPSATFGTILQFMPALRGLLFAAAMGYLYLYASPRAATAGKTGDIPE